MTYRAAGKQNLPRPHFSSLFSMRTQELSPPAEESSEAPQSLFLNPYKSINLESYEEAFSVPVR